MIDIHPPQHAPMTGREFFTHLFIVILGILIAIGLEQAVEYIHHRHEREALIENFHHECSDNLQVFDHDLDLARQQIAWDRASLAILRNAQGSVAKSSGKIELLPENLAEVFDRVDTEGGHWNDVVQPAMVAFQRITGFADRTGSALNTGATLHLTLAQREEAVDIIDNHLVQLQQERIWLAWWKGASISVLRGVQSRADMADDIRRANIASRQP